ncbi:thyroid transcription factor 1-associated protein 26 [Eublepharis macularius]|uniref:Thyroid transcription factor 1-associated protein 26 n=1 Tax=Eublepharis macularius TaxID=481883 RepID=A0AA97L7P4_EUBMA|nr:thyroid transcription factor 1-associated protein 26 [Eublepharis macularius]
MLFPPFPSERGRVLDDVDELRQRFSYLMAPAVRRGKCPSQKKIGGAQNSQIQRARKKTWGRDPRAARGSVQEGQGFAFWRKQKVQRAYKKLLKKQKDANSQKSVGYTDNYPEHLKHLYLAEEEMLKKQRKPKDNGPVLLEEMSISTTKINVTKRRLKAKTSNQKAKEEYEQIKAKRDEKKEAARKRKEERERAQKLYKQKKMEAYKILSKRTRKGQPNLNLQVEYLLQKIQQKP